MIRSACCHDKEFDWLERLTTWFFKLITVTIKTKEKGIGQCGAFTCWPVESILLQKIPKQKIFIRYCHLQVCGWMRMQKKMILRDYIYWYFWTRINLSLFVIIVSVWCNFCVHVQFVKLSVSVVVGKQEAKRNGFCFLFTTCARSLPL